METLENTTSNKKILFPVFIEIIAVILIGFFVFYSLFYPEYEQDQIRKNGFPAKGTILSIDPTGNSLNDQPQVKIHLEVKPEGKDTYEADALMIISPVYLPQFQPGKKVDLKYDPKDKFKVAIE